MIRRGFLLLALLTGPVPARAEQVLVQLLFGLSTEDGGSVSAPDWAEFVDDVLAPRVSGFTVLTCDGGWVDGARVVREGCKLVLVLADRPEHPALSEVVAEYKRRFRQKTVLRLEQPCPEARCRFE